MKAIIEPIKNRKTHSFLINNPNHFETKLSPIIPTHLKQKLFARELKHFFAILVNSIADWSEIQVINSRNKILVYRDKIAPVCPYKRLRFV
jgi:hypothetical protein